MILIAILAAALCFGAGYAVGSHKSPKEIVRMVRAEAESDADKLSEIVAKFADDFGDEWEALRLSPLAHGLESMIEKLKG